MMAISEVRGIIEQFGVLAPNEGIVVDKLTEGLVNESYKVSGATTRSVLQKLHPTITKNIIGDAVNASLFLNQNGIVAPIFMTTKDGSYTLESNGACYRVYSYIAGRNGSFFTRDDVHRISAFLRRIHDVLERMTYTPVGRGKNWHNTSAVIRELEDIAQSNVDDNWKKMRAKTLRYYSAFDGNWQRDQIIHGDIRIENFLIDHTGYPTAILDLDTICIGCRQMDLADLIRSAALTLAESDIGLLIENVISGYGHGHGFSKEILVQSIAQIATELAARFLIDAVRQSYFRHRTTSGPGIFKKNSTLAQLQLNLIQRLID